MFWKKKQELSCPVTPEDKEWIENNLDWLDRNLVELANFPTILPTKDFFDWTFTGKQDDAFYVLARIGELCSVNVSHIQLDFINDQLDFGNGLLTAIEKGENGIGGLYFGDEDGEAITIEKKQLDNPASLIAVMAHELSHHVLIGLHDIGYSDEKENEYLTDLTAIAYGFGIFLSSNATVYEVSSSHWRIGKQGYLPPQVIAYAMAVIHYFKGEIKITPSWIEHLDKKTKKYFLQSLDYVRVHPPAPTGHLNW
ncbi:hypothetical protein [Xanthocytophaga agilis]|uniref:Uncharacterized protein n=1 Tax=Xanthocytophaga agilis TaxID=3048010 RepID=A0AAE3UEY3_9BACT|nr:hypothetical protein [Xanthocytophaga agilis]MDJ1502710.1 hypothetical protein [Xanthocytophaga agilis]